MMQSKRACVVLYLEKEYETFMLQANFDCKQPKHTHLQSTFLLV
jgi:hypothetical protein